MNREELETWQQTRPREDAILIAQRAALRVFPIWASQMGYDWAQERSMACSPILRAYVTAGVAVKFPSNEVRVAAMTSSAAASAMIAPTGGASGVVEFAPDPFCSAVDAAAYAAAAASVRYHSSTSGAAVSAAASASASADGEEALWANVDEDVALLTEGKDLLSAPLWHVDAPKQILRAELEGLENLARETGDSNSFWHRWYFAAKRGEWLDWELQRDVALIPDEVWKQSPKAVMAAIAEIEARHAAKAQADALEAALAASDNGEDVQFNSETGKLCLVPLSALPPDIAAYAKRKIAKAITLFDDPSGQQLHGALAPDLAMLRHMVAEPDASPIDLYDVCASATRRLAVRVANGECPAPEKDAILADYRDRLRETGLDILSHDPIAQDVLSRRNAVQGNDAFLAAPAIAVEAAALVQPITIGVLNLTLPHDAEIATNPKADPEERKAATFRFAGRMLRIAKWTGGALAKATGGAVTAFILAGDLLEALSIIQASPIFQELTKLALRWLRFG